MARRISQHATQLASQPGRARKAGMWWWAAGQADPQQHTLRSASGAHGLLSLGAPGPFPQPYRLENSTRPSPPTLAAPRAPAHAACTMRTLTAPMARKAAKSPRKLAAWPNSTLTQDRPTSAQRSIISLSKAAALGRSVHVWSGYQAAPAEAVHGWGTSWAHRHVMAEVEEGGCCRAAKQPCRCKKRQCLL